MIMQQVRSDQLGDLAAIYDRDVEMVSIAREAPGRLPDLARRLFSERMEIQEQWIQHRSDRCATARALAAVIDASAIPAGEVELMAHEVLAACDALTALLGCEAVGVRVSTLRRPMCPRFHVDRIPCRMLITFDGPATEWIPAHEVDQALLADRGTDAVPVKSGGSIRQVDTGSWSLLKGGAWADQFNGVVHRSPREERDRLFVSLDPLFNKEGN